MTFEQLQCEAAKLDVARGTLGNRLDHILDSARVNADDTCYIEKARPASDYDRVALDTVVEILSYSSDTEAQEWFKARGIKY